MKPTFFCIIATFVAVVAAVPVTKRGDSSAGPGRLGGGALGDTVGEMIDPILSDLTRQQSGLFRSDSEEQIGDDGGNNVGIAAYV
ncbi:hypothetical protein EC991_008349 [Linnemannia zychae]|nr:hypothetical protein EC991_008349 [Linnemannia zychae]